MLPDSRSSLYCANPIYQCPHALIIDQQGLGPLSQDEFLDSLDNVSALHSLLCKLGAQDSQACSDKAYAKALAASVLLRQAAVGLLHFGASF